MANLKYRGNSTTPTKPTSTTAKNAPLTNDEIDGNLRSLNDSKLENSGWTPGDMFYADATGNLVRLPIGTSGQILTPVAGIPAWQPTNTVLDTIDVQEFSTPGTTTWIKPTNAKIVHIVIYGAGSSGAAGTTVSTSSNTVYTGAFGGAAGSRVDFWLPATVLESTVSLIVGAGGAQTSNSFSINGGGSSSFGLYIASGAAGSGVSAGQAITNGGVGAFGYYPRSITSTITYANIGIDGNAFFNYFVGNGGAYSSSGSSSTLTITSNAGGMGGLGSGGGGGGGGINGNGPTFRPGAAGGLGGGVLFLTNSIYSSNGMSGLGGAGGSSDGQSGSNGGTGYGSTTWDSYYGGNGGGGGASSVTGNGGNGGSGGIGAGGGGGGLCLSGFTPGLGGAGGNGYIKVTTFK